LNGFHSELDLSLLPPGVHTQKVKITNETFPISMATHITFRWFDSWQCADQISLLKAIEIAATTIEAQSFIHSLVTWNKMRINLQRLSHLSCNNKLPLII
jgi:hypothetical protein